MMKQVVVVVLPPFILSQTKNLKTFVAVAVKKFHRAIAKPSVNRLGVMMMTQEKHLDAERSVSL
jgi:hypothetical protein